MPNPTDEMKEDVKESELANPFTRVPSQRFKETFGGKSLASVFLRKGVSYMEKETFLKGFNLKLQKDASMVYDEIIEDCHWSNGEKWPKWLERPRNKWGDSPLEKALGNVFNIHFLAVTWKLCRLSKRVG